MDASGEMSKPGNSYSILGIQVAVTSLRAATETVVELSEKGSGSYVCAANVHMCMEAYRDPFFMSVVNGADLVVPDGKPLFWWMRSFGVVEAEQIRGPDLFIEVCERASEQNIPVGFYGGSSQTLELLQAYLKKRWPSLVISYAVSPPYRELTNKEQAEYTRAIKNSGTRILFVGLGCPKQERWMSDNRDRAQSVMIGVGAAFDFYAGTKKAAPTWMRSVGLEWSYRLLSEPKRLWRRYLTTNPHFMYLFAKSLIGKYVMSKPRNH